MQRSLFTETNYEEHKRLERLSALGDSLPRLNQVIDWEIFRPTLRQPLHTASQSHGGRPPYDVVLMFKILILERARRGHPLSEDQKKANKAKSKVRVRIEHVFGQMTVSFHGLTLRCTGMSRAAFNIALTNLAYNMRRYECLCRQTA